MPIGVEMPITVRGRPPQLSVGTADKPAKPPYIRPKKTAKATVQPAANNREPLRFQKRGQAEATSMSTMAAVATAGRHCSS